MYIPQHSVSALRYLTMKNVNASLVTTFLFAFGLRNLMNRAGTVANGLNEHENCYYRQGQKFLVGA